MSNQSLTDVPDHASTRRWVYWILIASATGAMAGRVLAVSSDNGHTPFLSANDRSRWCTIRALVDHGTYAIDEVVVDSRTGQFNADWQTIDMVRHLGRDGREHFYSSKPTLLPTLLAGQYKLIRSVTGAELGRSPFYVGRLMLLVSNVAPLVLLFVLMARLVERYGQTDWGRFFVIASTTWGTLLTTFCVTLNNHLPAAVSALIAAFCAINIWYGGQRGFWQFAMAGFFGAFAAANDLPALALFAAMGVVVLCKSPSRTLLAFVPAALLVAAGFFGTNYWAHQSWRPAYAHRSDGPLLLTLSMESQQRLTAGPMSAQLRGQLNEQLEGVQLSPSTRLEQRDDDEPSDPDPSGLRRRWAVVDPERGTRLAILEHRADPARLSVQAWDNWYDYEGSYWREGTKRGVDLGEASRSVYAFHILFGHHGLFSLTPIWLLAAMGLGLLLIGRPLEARAGGQVADGRQPARVPGSTNSRYPLQAFAWMVLAVSVVCIAFYIARPLKDRNYGGVTCGLRWLFWLIPLWLVCLIPAADAMAKTAWRRSLALCLLAISALSASYGGLNPWVHPWLYTYLEYLGY